MLAVTTPVLVNLSHADGRHSRGLMTSQTSADFRLCTLTLEYEGKTATGSCYRFFGALCEIRRVLELDHIQIMCNGARPDCVPTRRRGTCLTVLRFENFKADPTWPPIDVLGAALICEVGTLAQHLDYHNELTRRNNFVGDAGIIANLMGLKLHFV